MMPPGNTCHDDAPSWQYLAHRFFVEAVQFLKGSVDCEGIFRKSGSVARQRKLRVSTLALRQRSACSSAHLCAVLFLLPPSPIPLLPPLLPPHPSLLIPPSSPPSLLSSLPLGHSRIRWLSKCLQHSRCSQPAEAVFTRAPLPSSYPASPPCV